jgi:hypothetical protein
MNKQLMIGVGVGLLVLAVLVFVFTRSSGASDAAALSKEMPHAQAGAATFAPDVPVVGGGRGAVGRSTTSVPTAAGKPDAAGDGAAAPPPQ